MDFKELRKQSGMNLTQFGKYFGIPYRTIQNWERGERKCPEYLLELMKYKLEHKEKQGRWEDLNPLSWIAFQCSICHATPEEKTDYCPDCGAKMDK